MKNVIKRLNRGRKPEAKPTRTKTLFMPCADHVGSLLSAHARRKDNSRLGGDWLHVSALLGGDCRRAYLLASQENITAEVKPRVADRMLWAIGKTVEAHIREGLIELYGEENCLGRWKCACGQSEVIGVGGSKERCTNCTTVHKTYDEINLRDEETRLTGSPDFIVRDVNTGLWTVVEIKSIKVVPKNGVQTSAPEFHTLSTPSRSHALQALLYRWLMQRLGYEVSDEVLVIYGAKDYVMESPYKAFSVDGEADQNVMAVENLTAVASEYADAVRAKTLTPRIPQCSSINSTRAKACPCVVSCFARRS